MHDTSSRERISTTRIHARPPAVQRKLWELMWDRLLAPLPSAQQAGHLLDDSHDHGERQTSTNDTDAMNREAV